MPAYSQILPREVDISTFLTKTIKLNVPMLSAAMDTVTEASLAIALAREEPSLHELLSAPDLNFYAGFVLRNENDAGCKAGSRCVHVIVSRGDGQQHVAHAIVDLMTRRVVHAALDPDRKPDPVADKN